MNNIDNTNNTNTIKRGDVYTINLEGKGSCQGGFRPVVVISNNMANKYSPVIQVSPLTTKTKKSLPTHVLVKKEHGLITDSIILAEQTMLVNSNELINKVTHLNADVMRKLDKCLLIQMGLVDSIKNLFTKNDNMKGVYA